MSAEPWPKTNSRADQALTLLVANLVRAWNAHDVDRIVDFYAPDYEGMDVAEAGPQRGPEAVRRSMDRYLQGFPDLSFTAESTLVQGDRVALVWLARGTHQGKLMKIPATGRAIAVRGVSILTFRERRVWRAQHIWDLAGLLRAIGLLPELS